MHHLVVESCLFQRLLVEREFHMGYTHTFASLWIGQRSNGTGSGGVCILLIIVGIMVNDLGGESTDGEHGC